MSQHDIPIDASIGPDGETLILHRHIVATCDCETCATIRWQQAEREQFARYIRGKEESREVPW